MTKFKNLGTVARALAKIDKSSPAKQTNDQDGERWKKLKVPVKALVLLKLSGNKNDPNKKGKISKGKPVKPNPAFKKDAWKKQGAKTKSTISTINSENNSDSKSRSNLRAGDGNRKTPKKGILKSEAGERTRKKSVTINPREKKPISYGRLKRSKAKKDDLQEELANSPETDQREADIEANVSETQMKARAHWKKVRLMLHYLKFPTPGILSLKDKNKKDQFSFSANLKAIQMVKKFKKIKKIQKNCVPRSGGKRPAGSFDYLG